ncbi:TetR/AcrR family transcriptional regulator C-terminal domain-containing protein [Actinomadura sp. NPDC048032]|uniref:TetR/AcrR family transcriptional regulator C-terminal domain-containing protein n=1 Tax=Actinomadura sp. NPDC048032 TaxID=3155747 RepID=UPI0033EE7A84
MQFRIFHGREIREFSRRTEHDIIGIRFVQHRIEFLLSRPWLLDLRQSTPPMGPRRLLWLDRALDALSGTGLDGGQKFNAATVLTGYALTDATLTHSLGAGGKELAARAREPPSTARYSPRS